jgi:hypothetical protein
MDDIQEVAGDGVEDPGDDHEVHASPGRIVEATDIAEDVVSQREPTEDEEDIAAPLGVVGRLEIQNNRDQVLDVLDAGRLAVQMSDGRDVGVDRVVIIVSGLGGVITEAIPEGDGLQFQGVGLRALLLEGVSGGADAFLGIGGRLEESTFLLKLLAALGVGRVQGGSLVRQLLGGDEGLVTQLDGGGGGGRGGGAGGGGHGRWCSQQGGGASGCGQASIPTESTSSAKLLTIPPTSTVKQLVAAIE